MDPHRDRIRCKRKIVRSLAFIALAFADFVIFGRLYPEFWFLLWLAFLVLTVIALAIVAASIGELLILAIQERQSTKPPCPHLDDPLDSN